MYFLGFFFPRDISLVPSSYKGLPSLSMSLNPFMHCYEVDVSSIGPIGVLEAFLTVVILFFERAAIWYSSDPFLGRPSNSRTGIFSLPCGDIRPSPDPPRSLWLSV